MITVKELKYLDGTFDKEGIDYAFRGYSSFSEIDDEEFHRIRKEYLKAKTLSEMGALIDDLENYLHIELREYYIK